MTPETKALLRVMMVVVTLGEYDIGDNDICSDAIDEVGGGGNDDDVGCCRWSDFLSCCCDKIPEKSNSREKLLVGKRALRR